MTTRQLSLVRQAARRARRLARRSRRGMVLLVTVSLLTLFLLIGLTYAIVAIACRDAARTQALNNMEGDRFQDNLDTALYILLRDPADGDIRNAMRGNGLLRDRYGSSFRAT